MSKPAARRARLSARAELLAKRNSSREEEAAFIFHKYDADNSGDIDEDELLRCFADLGFKNARAKSTDGELREWVRRELKKGSKKGGGKLSLDEFIEYYNRYIVGHRRVFEDTYELGAQIGKGAFGAVFRAKTLAGSRSGESVAVKQVPKESGVKMELLHNEITIWEGLRHPNLVALLDVFEEDEKLLLVTELMKGGDLFRQLTRFSTFSEGQAMKLGRQIVSAVAYLHEHGVVHCDLKPSNILVAEAMDALAERGDMTVKIADFGLSQWLHSARGEASDGAEARRPQKLTEVCGTPDYFAPELAELAQCSDTSSLSLLIGEEGSNQEYGPPLDCWAVGCILYELLAGHPPYQAVDEAVLFYKITENQMEFPADVFDEVTDDAKQLIRNLTRTAPAERASCSEALEHPWLDASFASKRATPLPPVALVKRRSSLVARDLPFGEAASRAADGA